MLNELAVTDLGVIRQLRLVLAPGMTAVTGETGAGKTLVVEAIELLVGGRADPTMVRPGAREAVVEGRFVVGDQETVVRRVVPASGRSRAYVDGGLATAGALAELGRSLVDLHGQHDHQSLLAPSVQRDALDRFGGVDLEPLVAARQELARVDRQLAELGGDDRARARELDLLRFQVDELAAAGLSDPDEDAMLEAEEDALAGALAHQEAAARALEALDADDGAIAGLAAAVAALDDRRPFAETADRLRDLSAELSDITSTVRAQGEAIEDDPARLDAVQARRRLLHELTRKYGETLAEVIKNLAPDGIYYGGITTEAGILRKQMIELGLDMPMYGIWGFYDPQFISIAGPAANGTIVEYANLPENPKLKAMEQAYKDHKFAEPIGPYTQYAYEATKILLQAIKDNGYKDKIALGKAIRAIKYDGVLGVTTFDDHGQTKVPTELDMKEVKDGKWVDLPE